MFYCPAVWIQPENLDVGSVGSCPDKAVGLSPGLKPISADLMRGASMGAWFLSRRDSTIVARHAVPG
jgi:hypothetical protein